MARLITSGFEVQALSTTANYGGEGDAGTYTAVSSVTPAITTSVVRSGAAALECDQGAANYVAFSIPGMTTTRAYFARAYMRFTDASPGTASTILSYRTGATLIAAVQLTTGGTLALLNSAAAQIGSASSVLSDNAWYRIEFKVIVPAAGNGTAELLLDGTTVASSAAASVGTAVATPTIRVGSGAGGTAGVKTYVDDFALNDDQGASQTGYPGAAKVVLLKPTSVNAIGNWVGPQTTGDDTTNLNLNVDNTPPLGVGHSDVDANADKYVFNITNAATQHFDVNVASYTAAGVVAADTIQLVQAIARMSVNTTSGTNTGAVAGVSNPACTAATAKDLELSAAGATEPTGWKTFRSAVAYAPSVTLGTEPVVRATKEVANVNAAQIDLMGLYVEYVVGVSSVSADRAVVYSIKNAVSADRRAPYAILNPVSADRRIVYGIPVVVTADRRVVYSMQGAVASSRQIVYGITSTVNADRRVVYAITVTAAADRAVVYGIFAGPIADCTIRYTIRAIPAEDPTPRYSRTATLSAHPFAPGQVVGVYRADEASLRYVRQGDLPPGEPVSTATVDSENRLEVTAELGRVLLAAETGQTVNRRPSDTYPTAQPEIRYTTTTITT